MDSAIVVVPIKGDSNVFAACPIFRNFVMLFENANQMHRMFFPNILYPKIIDNKCEQDGSGFMSP